MIEMLVDPNGYYLSSRYVFSRALSDLSEFGIYTITDRLAGVRSLDSSGEVATKRNKMRPVVVLRGNIVLDQVSENEWDIN